MRTRPVRRLLVAALASALALGAGPALAQSTSATIRGQVLADSAPAAGAQVTVVNTATGLRRTVQSTPQGQYVAAGLPPGPAADDGGQFRPAGIDLGHPSANGRDVPVVADEQEQGCNRCHGKGERDRRLDQIRQQLTIHGKPCLLQIRCDCETSYSPAADLQSPQITAC